MLGYLFIFNMAIPSPSDIFYSSIGEMVYREIYGKTR